ncbi:MAG TPA: NAD(P)H-hydrate dehydratase, partial [Bacteroidales bacterium]|nr:NAD(P)H-hydrate dehydratase [Bacteroidales bacterium]
ALQAALPEAMVSPDSGTGNVTALPDLKPYNAIGVGPGLGTDPDTASVLRELLKNISVPLILDADALNIIAQNREWLDLLPPLTVLTPHPGEFRRLTGTTSTDFRLVQEQREFAVRYRCVVVLKGAHTSVALPDGTLFFNSTGNPGMATGGSGDVLTGIITSLLAQGYDPSDAAVAGVYLHGLSGDIALRIHSEEAVIAGDILMNIGRAFRETNFSNFNVYL